MITLYNINGKILCNLNVVFNLFTYCPKTILSTHVDTGCRITRISLCKLYKIKNPNNLAPLKKDLLNLARQGNKDIKLVRPFGVNEKKVSYDLYALSDQEIIQDETIGFSMYADDFLINNTSFGKEKVNVFVNDGVNLLGMSFLQKHDWKFVSNTDKFILEDSSSVSKASCIEKFKELLKKKLKINTITNILQSQFGFSTEDIAYAENVVLADLYYEED